MKAGGVTMTPAEIEDARPMLVRALEEDIGSGDVTSEVVIDPDVRARAEYVVKQSAIACGLPLVGELLKIADSGLRFEPACEDGSPLEAGAVMATLEGNARSILTVERTSLNFLQRLTGIATATGRYVSLLGDAGTRILDTRKTVPGYRLLDKYAVRCGGGDNHRAGLFDAVLIKNNHLVFHPGPAEAVRRARAGVTGEMRIEVEVRTLEELKEAVLSGADMVMIDNFSPEVAREAVAIAAGRVPIEASGGITLDSVKAYADAGVDYISVGALTHSVRAADIHLRLHPLDS